MQLTSIVHHYLVKQQRNYQRDKFTLILDKAKKLFHVLKIKISTYFWGISVTKIPQKYPIMKENCKTLLISPNKVSLKSIQRAVTR